MLKIQLCPESELENKYRWVPDVAVLVLAALGAWFSAEFALNAIRADTQHFNQTSENWTRQISEIQPAVQKFKNLDAEVALLNRKIDALKHITISPIDKILPIVVVEQLQTLRPEGVWFHEVTFAEDKSIRIKGASNDSLLISEFLLGLRESMNPETVTSDVRTQLGYDSVAVKEIKDEATDPGFKDIKNVLVFDASGVVVEKVKPLSPSPAVAIPVGRSRKGAWF